MRKAKQEKKKQDNNQLCQVCLTLDPPQKNKPSKGKQVQNQRRKVLEMFSCVTCKFKVHKYCYDPYFNQPKAFKCDFCKQYPKNKQQRRICFICQTQGNILKLVDNKFVHIQCALSSQLVVLQNFKNLKFRLNAEFKQGPKQRVGRQKAGSGVNKCTFCKSGSSQALFKCHKPQCDHYSHLYCLQANKFAGASDDILSDMLDQTLGSFRVRNYDFLKRNDQSLRGIGLLPKSKKNVNMITCGAHSSDIVWCSACFKIGDPIKTAECSRCLRWAHLSCLKMTNKSEQSYIQCNACFDNNKFLQRTLFPQLIYLMVQIQTSSLKWTRENVKYLDCFAFKSSTEICDQILHKNRQQFQYYHLYWFLEKQYLKGVQMQKKVQNFQKLLQKITSKDLKGFTQKKIIQVLYFLKHKQVRNAGQINTPAEIDELRTVYPSSAKRRQKVKFLTDSQKEQQKCKRILNKLIDLYISGMRQAQLKDVSIKLVQFSDKIRRQVVSLQENDFISDPVKSLSKSESQKIIGQVLRKRPYQIALHLRQLFKMLSLNKDKLKGKFQFQSSIGSVEEDQNALSEGNTKGPKSSRGKHCLNNNFLMMLIKCIVSRDEGCEDQVIQCQDLQDLIDSYRKIVYISRVSNARPVRKLTLSQGQLYKIMNKSYDVNKTKISEQSKVKICRFFKSLIKENKIKQSHQLKCQLTERYDTLIQQDKLNYKQTLIMRENIAEQGLFVDRHSKLMTLEKRAIYYRVLKIKYIKIVNLQLQSESYNQSFPLKVNQKNRKDILDNVKRLLEANDKSILLSQAQKISLEYFLVKQEVFSNILREETALGDALDSYNPEEQDKIQLQNNGEQQRMQNSQDGSHLRGPSRKGALSMLQRIKRVFAYWIQHTIECPQQIIKTLYPIASKKIRFPLQYQSAFNQLIESMGTRYDMQFKCSEHISGSWNGSHRMNSEYFMKLWRLIEYAQLQNVYEKLKTLSEEYKQWVYDLENRYNPISKVLEDKQLNCQLLQVIDRKISEAERFQVDLKSEVKRLRTVKLWVVLSQKFQKDFQRKPTINAIQQFKSLMLKINYPHNQIYQKVLDLQLYGRQINDRIQKYLKKQKQQQLEFYEQLCLVSNKMTIAQAEALKLELENSKLDVTAQLQELEDEITNYNQIPSKLDPLLKRTENLEELLKIKAKILDTPIKYENMESYCHLVHRISFLKCQTLEPTITRKDFFRLLNTSDMGAVALTQKMPWLLKAYRDIEKAEKELLLPRPKYENLLPIDGKKIRTELSSDPTTLHHIEKVYQRVQILRDKFKMYKTSRVQYEKYLLLEYQLSHFPVNYKDISTEIQNMKKQLDILTDRSLMIKKNFNPRQASELVRAYSRIGIRNQDLQQIKRISQSYGICVSLSERQEDYGEFSQKCREYNQLWGIMTLNETRSQLFQQYSDQVLQLKNEGSTLPHNILSLLHTLIYEGTFLLHHVILASKSYTPSRGRLLQKLLKINKKVQEITKSPSANKKDKRLRGQDQDQFDDDEQYDDSTPYDDDQSEGFDEERDQMGGYDQEEQYGQADSHQYDQEDQDQEDSIPVPPKKRAQPLVMEISDQDEQPEPQLRKITHVSPVQPAHQIISQGQEASNPIPSDKP